MPVVMISSLTEQGASVTLDAIEFGALDFVTKPTGSQGRHAGTVQAIIDKNRGSGQCFTR